MEYKGVRIEWLGHDTFKLRDGSGTTIYIDPYRLKRDAKDKADVLLISHEHFDHLSVDDARKVASADKTIVVTTRSCADGLKGLKVKEVKVVKPWERVDLQRVLVEAVPAYNTNKINPDTRKPFHPKDAGMVGFVVTIGGVRIYHAGDTDAIEELRRLSNIDVALLPVSGTYVMTVEEAVEAVRMVRPNVAIPMHYGTIVGSAKDAERFKSMVKECEVHILKPIDDY
ncbi:MAG: MBL fold metallo-hydrolase [Candidatus Nitrosocaldus sp.]|nr:MBL fold metallo-hydrolase [Candidatus Nitrosocaldus sp.]MCS7141194.1 MBL fold metallo-hydrolase [Candidatus Nitrosocaldus sp.]MDW8000200.1 MBL fold metallo-hydrolase [Candidatus Nitrosocaldus sp.]MDW8275655.1 MBL fold metallo-hydrolase [Candidatus Nitrosocaldus sp.]